MCYTKNMSMTSKYMSQAQDEARQAFQRAEIPVGAVVVDVETGQIIAIAGNETEKRNDPTAHAEIFGYSEGL